MLFNSIHFVLFFPVVVVLYFLIKPKYRWILLLAASYYFYASWKLEYLSLIIISTLIDYVAAIQMSKTEDKKKRKKWLVLSLLTNLGILFSFKYFNFFNESVQQAFDLFNVFYNVPAFDVLLPVGISFYTFQTLSYSIDVYKGDKKAEKHLGIFALYVAFFPQLVAGPIERSSRLLPQFFEKYKVEYYRIADGLRLMLWGFFKKLVIADRLAIYVDTVYNNQANHSGWTLTAGTIFFAFQIYCDFSGYSDIAIGTARVMGYRLMDNFRRPYFARSIREFWQRWHISLSSWFRDYVYIPLGGNRVVKWKMYYNLFITFLVSGLWHGANWTFIVWGGLHGLYLMFAIITAGFRNDILRKIGIAKDSALNYGIDLVVTFILAVFAWIFFRANNIGDAFAIIGKIAQFDGPLFMNPVSQFVYSASWILFLLLVETKWEFKLDKIGFLHSNYQAIRHLSYAIMIILIIMFAVFDGGQFIYFQF
ncbi:MAG: MBOAT family protein [Chitinophagales bacterium]|nr:MBOAT family protein [Chitinophagales bacterium]